MDVDHPGTTSLQLLVTHQLYPPDFDDIADDHLFQLPGELIHRRATRCLCKLQPGQPHSRIQFGFPRLWETRFRLGVGSRWQLAPAEINITSQHPAAQIWTVNTVLCATSSPLSTRDIQEGCWTAKKRTERQCASVETLASLKGADTFPQMCCNVPLDESMLAFSARLSLATSKPDVHRT